MVLYERTHHPVLAVHNYNIPKPRFKLSHLLLPFIVFSFLRLIPWATRSSNPFPTQKPVQLQRLTNMFPDDDPGIIACDRRSSRSDICYMSGDVRTQGGSSSVIVYTFLDSASSTEMSDGVLQITKIKPYPRKWERESMATVGELSLVLKRKELSFTNTCDVNHNVPAVIFSTSGYTGNLYHEFNDGILPLYITAQRFNRGVVFVVKEYHTWWISKYSDILSQLTDFPVVDFAGDRRTHCFPQAIVGLKVHDELTVDPSLMDGNKTIHDFRNLLNKGFAPRVHMVMSVKEREKVSPKMVILSRRGGREIMNQKSMAKLAKKIGFTVQIMRPTRSTELWRIYCSLNSSDVMVGVHGAAMAHFLFLQREAVFIQIIPLGTDWAAEAYYGSPARKLGLKYLGYKIQPEESSLFHEYNRDDPVIANPDAINHKGWNFTKSIYLKRQNINLNLVRFRRVLENAYSLIVNRNVN